MLTLYLYFLEFLCFSVYVCVSCFVTVFAEFDAREINQANMYTNAAHMIRPE